ncbi:hypothetical protein MN205_11460 [Kineococcus sp. TRM81007]|nr:hypothetical protein [Kineococcus sp. TRM81007]MCI2239104.1 hypothetical protein [Kineococcus sp. TRM81007]
MGKSRLVDPSSFVDVSRPQQLGGASNWTSVGAPIQAAHPEAVGVRAGSR